MIKILIMGLPGSGKTTLAGKLFKKLKCDWWNADRVRGMYDDWDFSEEGRLRQARRMAEYASMSKTNHVIIDMVCPLPEMRNIINPDKVIWMNTIDSSRFTDTDAVFVPPSKEVAPLEITSFEYNLNHIIDYLNSGY